MSVDKNLFLYDLAVVSIMKNEGPYIKEWLDYHLLAGVDHFFIYDNDSPDNQREVLQPYIDAGLVTYIFFPGTSPQFPAYDDAFKRFRFLCRYMTFIDGDEFIFPKSKSTIAEVVDEILGDKLNVGGLAINWHCFGSSGQREKDLSRGVLKRFTYHVPNEADKQLYRNAFIKDVVNPRRISYIDDPHKMNYYEGFYTINEDEVIVTGGNNNPVTDKKIVINHYVTKSYEEYVEKNLRGHVVYNKGDEYVEKIFNDVDENSTIFDDEILKYREIMTTRQGGAAATFKHLQPSNKLIMSNFITH